MKKTLLLMTLVVLAALTTNARNIWTGSEVIDWNQGKAVQIASDQFADVREGDQLVFGIVFTTLPVPTLPLSVCKTMSAQHIPTLHRITTLQLLLKTRTSSITLNCSTPPTATGTIPT